MGADVQQHLTGRKGGSSKPKQPSIARDSLQSVATAKLLLAVGEGEFAEGPSDQDIYLDNTPLMDASGNVNFPNVKWEWRSGSVDQDYIPGIPSVENENTVNVELRSDTPWVRSISNTQLSAVRLRFAWPALQEQKSNGDVTGYRIEYAVDVSTDGGAYAEVLLEAVDGKTTSRYERSRRIDLPPATSGWQVRVRRITPNKNSSLIADTMLIAGMTEVIDAKLRYPNTALLYIEFSAEQFSNIPAITVECKARKVQVPTTYDPDARTYTGVWDGSFKSAWTNNPAWITYDISTNARFGLGKRIKPWMVDKWELYKIAQYCDQLVPDGNGGQEPRFLCDLNLQSRAQAWTLLRDIAAIYRGMSYWAQGQLVSQADMPRTADFDYVFTRANVIDGKMTYGGASVRTRYSRALVSYDNPANNYDTDVTGYSDPALLRRYGDNPVELSAIGCTRESEAQRRGKWTVLTSVQDRTITFATGMEGRIPLPGYIIPVADSLRAGREIGGRISAVNGKIVTLDRDTQAKAGDRLIINLPSGRAEGRTVQSVSGRDVAVTTAYSEIPGPELCWALDADDLAVQLYRVMSTKRDDNGQWTISGLQYEPSKYGYIDTGARLEDRPISVIPISTVPAPESVTLTSGWAIDQGIAVSTMTIAWPAVEGAVAYDVEWKRDSGNWIRLPRQGSASVDVVGIYAGSYLARVRAVSPAEITSVWRTSLLTELLGKTGEPPAPVNISTTSLVFGIRLDWGIPAGAEDTAYSEVQIADNNQGTNATGLGLFAAPTSTYTHSGMAAAVVRFFRIRLIDRTGNVGPWSAWVNGMSSADADEILDYLTGQITETQLGDYLAGEVDKISGDGPGSVNERIAEAVADVKDALVYDPAISYSEGDCVRGGPNGRRLYQALVNVPSAPDGSNAPPNPALWLDIGETVETANGLASVVEQNTLDISEIDGRVNVQGQSLDLLRAEARPARHDGEKADSLRGWRTQASYAQLVRVQATDTEASVERDTQLTASVGDTNGRITIEEQVRASADAALSSRTETIEARLPAGSGQLATSASVQTVAQAQADQAGELSAMWAVKLEVGQGGQYEVAGIGVGIENVGGVLQSQFIVRANRFAILNNTGGGLVSPFIVSGGQTIMNSAVIGDASITNAKIGDVIQSNAIGSNGQPLWQLNKAGSFLLNSAGSGGRLQQTAEAIKIYDSNGVLRVQLGNLSA